MVPLTRQVVLHIRQLTTDAEREAIAEPVGVTQRAERLGEAAPRVDPVRDAARGDVGRIEIDRHLADPAIDQSLPHAQILQITSRRAGIGEIEAVIEFAPLEAPFPVSRQLRAKPTRLDTELERATLNRKAAFDDGVGDRTVPVQMFDDTERAARSSTEHVRRL